MKYVKWIFSVLILVLALTTIVGVTVYTLNNKGIRKEIKEKVKQNIEKVTSNEGTFNLTEIYNIYLNNEKHKVKLEYNLGQENEENTDLILFVYFDGKNVFEDTVASMLSAKTIHDVFQIPELESIIKIDEKKFKILSDEESQYLLIDIGKFGDNIKEYFYVLNNNGDFVSKKSFLVRDSSINYIMGEEAFSQYYDNENKTLAKTSDNEIYALEEKKEKKKLYLVEYKYFIKDGKFEKEEILKYDEIKVSNSSVDDKE